MLKRISIAAAFGLGFVGAYLSLPVNLWLGGEGGFLLRPEPVIIPAALPFGLPAIIGTSIGVLLHNLFFRLTPMGVTIPFSVAQTIVVLAASYLAMTLRQRLPRPFNNLAATWLISALIILVLGGFAALEYGTPVLEEWEHILREVLIPINVFGLLVLEAIDFRGRASTGNPKREGL